jgi:hypothetical protein
LVVLFALLPRAAAAEFIDFTKLSISARDVLTIGDLTITSPGTNTDSGGPFGQVGTVRGEGLGVGNFGSLGGVDAWEYWGEAPPGAPSLLDGTLEFQIANGGRITALTVMPFLTHIAGPVPTIMPTAFSFSYDPDNLFPPAGQSISYKVATPGEPLTIQFTEHLPDRIKLVGLKGDMGQEPFFNPTFLESPDTVFHYGFSVTSIEYTPVPEPGSLLLLTMGAGGLALARRSRRKPRPEAPR